MPIMLLFLRAAQTQPQGALQPPPGVTPSFINPYSLEGYVLATQIIFFTLVPICVLSRLYTSFVIIDRVGLEDCKQNTWPSPEITLTVCRYLLCFLGEMELDAMATFLLDGSDEANYSCLRWFIQYLSSKVGLRPEAPQMFMYLLETPQRVDMAEASMDGMCAWRKWFRFSR